MKHLFSAAAALALVLASSAAVRADQVYHTERLLLEPIDGAAGTGMVVNVHPNGPERYAIERELGAGGMATVYLAADLKHDRKVAIKVLKPELAAVLGAERFVVEIKTTAALQHPHILPLFDSGEAGGFLYYVMPYIEGETLRDRLNRESQLGVDDAVRMTCDIADALHYAHEHGVIHRDIKPENILLHDGRAQAPGPHAGHALLLQLTTNLVHNAIVHNLPENGTGWVTTSASPGGVVLTVENTSPQLSPQVVSTLVEPFVRGAGRTRTDDAGVGLGLAIVERITRAHDGSLTLTPRPDGGLSVTLQLPAPTTRTGA